MIKDYGRENKNADNLEHDSTIGPPDFYDVVDSAIDDLLANKIDRQTAINMIVNYRERKLI